MKPTPAPIPDKSLASIFGIPLIIAVLSIFGLISALLGQGGVWYWLSWLTLSLPIILILIFALRPQRTTKQ